MQEMELRERALVLACQYSVEYERSENTVARARVFLDFLQGTQDAGIIDAARLFSDQVQKVTAGG
jgi:hypothetical protein